MKRFFVSFLAGGLLLSTIPTESKAERYRVISKDLLCSDTPCEEVIVQRNQACSSAYSGCTEAEKKKWTKTCENLRNYYEEHNGCKLPGRLAIPPSLYESEEYENQAGGPEGDEESNNASCHNISCRNLTEDRIREIVQIAKTCEARHQDVTFDESCNYVAEEKVKEEKSTICAAAAGAVAGGGGSS